MVGLNAIDSEPLTSTASSSRPQEQHSPDVPDTPRIRLLKRIEDNALSNTVGFDAMMLNKIGKQNYLLEQHQKHLLEKAGVDLTEYNKSEGEGEDMPWAGTSVGNEYHYHGVMPPNAQPQPAQPTPTTPPVEQPTKEPSLISKLAPALITGASLLGGSGLVGYGLSQMKPDTVINNPATAPIDTDTRETIDVTGGIPR